MKFFNVMKYILVFLILALVGVLYYYSKTHSEYGGFIILMLAGLFIIECLNFISIEELKYTGDDIIASEYNKILKEDKKWQQQHQIIDDIDAEICGRCD